MSRTRIQRQSTQRITRSSRTRGLVDDDDDVVLQGVIGNAASQYASYRTIASAKGERVAKGCLAQLIRSNESSAGISTGTVSLKTVISRVNRNNISGLAHQCKSPLQAIEHVVVDACIHLAEIGCALTKYEVISLTEEIIAGTEHEKQLLDYKRKRKIRSKSIIGKKWYDGFMKRNEKAIKRGRCKIRDQKDLLDAPRITLNACTIPCMTKWSLLVLPKKLNMI